MILCIYSDTICLKQLKTLSGGIGPLYTDTKLMTPCQICLPPHLFHPEHLGIIIPIHSCQQH